jgi:glycosyltransferase involved in cell wall biosynthesis
VFVTTDSRMYHPRHYHLMGRALRRAGLYVVVVGRESDGAPAPSDTDIDAISFPRSPRRIVRMLSAPRLMWAALRLKPSLVQIDSLELVPWAALTKLFCDVPIVYDSNEDYASAMLIRGWLPAPLRGPVSRLVGALEPRLAARLDATFTADRPSAEKFRGLCSQLQIVHNFPWASFADSAPSPAAAPTPRAYDITYHGSLDRHFEDLIIATARALNDRGTRARWCIAAREFGIEEQRRLEARLGEFGLRAAFTLKFNLPYEAIPRLLAESRIGFIPWSNVEKHRRNLPRKLFEFMAAGRPAVVSDLPNIRAVGGDACLYATPGDPDAYAAALATLLAEPALAQRMGIRGRVLREQAPSAERELAPYVEICTQLATVPRVTR